MYSIETRTEVAVRGDLIHIISVGSLLQVSKPRFFHKPKYPDLRSSLEAMKDHVTKNGVKELCMPRIGCGLDGLDWDKVRKILGEVFAGTDVHLAVYYL